MTCSTENKLWQQTWACLGKNRERNANVQIKEGKVTETRNLRMQSIIFLNFQQKQQKELCEEKLSGLNILLKFQENKNSLIWASEKLKIKFRTKLLWKPKTEKKEQNNIPANNEKYH